MYYKYSIIENFENVESDGGTVFQFFLYDILKLSYLFKFRGRFYFSVFGEIVNRQPFTELIDAEEFLKSKQL